MKKTIHALGALTIAAALNLFATACTNDDNFVNDEPQIEQPAAVKTYQVNIPATIGGDGAQTRAVSFDGTTSNSTFESSEKVYVYNATTDEVMGGYLQPSDISADGKHCNLTGTLTGGTISETNNLKLIYNPTIVVTDKTDNNHKIHTYFNYNTQDGTQAGVIDGAKADVTVDSYTGGVLTTTATASFQNVQSMFRFKFVDETSAPISVKVLQITTSSSGIHSYYYPIRTDPFSNQGIMLNLPTSTSDYIYFGMAIDENCTDDVLTFTVTDGSGNVYKGTKSAPDGGFKNGKYYYNSSAITLTKQNYVTPDITWTNPSTPITPDEYFRYMIPNSVSNSDITISGTCKGYWFRLEQNGTVRLNNLTATYDGNDFNFIECLGSLTLEVNGTNTINCNNYHVAVLASSSGTLKLTGNGTLTVHVNGSGDTKCGLQCNGNYTSANSTNDYNNTGVVDVTTQLALDPAKTTVTRGARSGDSTNGYTWTYTVTTNN